MTTTFTLQMIRTKNFGVKADATTTNQVATKCNNNCSLTIAAPSPSTLPVGATVITSSTIATTNTWKLPSKALRLLWVRFTVLIRSIVARSIYISTLTVTQRLRRKIMITTGNHPKALWPGVKAWWVMPYDEFGGKSSMR